MSLLTQRLSTLVVVGLCLFALQAAGRGALGVARNLAEAAHAPAASPFEIAASVARFLEDRPAPWKRDA
ncbi:MAG TPA: hypothetical protein VKU90_08735 [Caulobacteraceae bacterium]|nr:hypothetical protein [Caulobacteraceae bacterium]